MHLRKLDQNWFLKALYLIKIYFPINLINLEGGFKDVNIDLMKSFFICMILCQSHSQSQFIITI
jgi:hypothetical protein